jgi:chromosomal replication initiator protein
MKRYYRNLDILLVDDIQFLQNRLNFEEEFCNMFEALINQSKQIVITSDKPPGQLKLSERMIARMEWGLVAHMGTPDLETRVAILQYKAEAMSLHLSSQLAFYIAEHIHHNVRQLEGAMNRLSAYCRLMHLEPTQEVVDSTLNEMFQAPIRSKISVDRIIHSVASMFNVRESDLRGTSRSKEVAYPRQIAMYLAKELLGESLMKIASSFGGKTHSTLLHAWKKISKELENDAILRRQLQMTRQNIEA